MIIHYEQHRKLFLTESEKLLYDFFVNNFIVKILFRVVEGMALRRPATESYSLTLASIN